MSGRLYLAVSCLFATVLAAAPPSYEWQLPPAFPKPRVPVDNPMTAAKVDLGRHLFYDTRLSVNGKSSCATCHKQELAFTDGLPASVGTTGQFHSRGSMSLVNVAYSSVLTWSNPQLTKLEDQALVPMYGEHPVELGLQTDDKVLNRLREDPVYVQLFARAFPESAKGSEARRDISKEPLVLGGVLKTEPVLREFVNSKDPVNRQNAVYAIASFERSIISADSPYDRYHYGGDNGAISDSAKRGEILFFSQQLSCFRCHGGYNFSDNSDSALREKQPAEFHNTGLYNLPGPLSYPAPNVGTYEFTKSPADVGKFKAPTLRNIAVTGPYMHDGSMQTLAEVLEHYADGGRTIEAGPHAGKGHDNPNKDPLIGGFTLSPRDEEDLIAFLQSLTDTTVLHDQRFSNPWKPAK